MQRVVETMMEWGELFGSKKLLYPTRFGRVQVESARAQIWSGEPDLRLSISFRGPYLDERFDLDKWYRVLREALEGTDIEVEFGGMSCHSHDNSVFFVFRRIRGEEICLTVFKTYLLILKRLGVQSLETIGRTAPKITQGTYWRRRDHMGEVRGLWISHGEHLASKIRIPS